TDFRVLAQITHDDDFVDATYCHDESPSVCFAFKNHHPLSCRGRGFDVLQGPAERARWLLPSPV
ncbi:TPA: hypothetical protein ACV8JL_004896, partial [Escherichia coli]